MLTDLERLTSELMALALPPTSRALLSRMLIESLDEGLEPDAELNGLTKSGGATET